jgi:hypothetical protein
MIIENIVIVDLHNQTHTTALLFLLNEYAKNPMGGGAELSWFAKLKRSIF